ncbi:MAG: hypothetical protein H6567_06115 [Lewinellaceae bacterium]|nr:hypothetical protein [Lewinellaceae bacterium]
MKRIITIFLFSVCINFSHAQFVENHAIYSAIEANNGNYSGIDLNLNYIYKDKFSFKVGYSGNRRKPKSQPEDYKYHLIWILSDEFSIPYDKFKNYNISLGKIYTLNASGTLRANLSLGIGFTTIKEPENWQKNTNIYWAENYSWNYKEYKAISLIINPKIEFPFFRFTGLSIYSLVQINKYRTFFGVGMGQMIGLCRKRKIQVK